jgi:hypothetical protein
MTEQEFNTAFDRLIGMLRTDALWQDDGRWLDKYCKEPGYYILRATFAVMRDVLCKENPETYWDLLPADAVKFLGTLDHRQREALREIATRIRKKELH